MSGLNLSRCDNSSSATASSGSYLNKTTTSIDPSIEGSLEYRELKRMYLRERNQAEEWRKDYYVIKKQLAKVKETTIRKCNSFLRNKPLQIIVFIFSTAQRGGVGMAPRVVVYYE